MELSFASAEALASLVARRDIGLPGIAGPFHRPGRAAGRRHQRRRGPDFDRARDRARSLDAQPPPGKLRGAPPLFGVPMTVKESFNIAGLPTTWGAPEHRGNIATRNALAVDRLLEAGAVIFGKTNVPRMLGEWQSFNAVYGRTNNPWDLATTPGGSSGGAAEAKSYAGEYYPTVRRGGPAGFSLVELLVSIGVVGILVALLLPALAGARRSADTIACEANLHAIGQGMTIYLAQNHNTFPPSYIYIGQQIVGEVQTPTQPSAGYVHWSSYLYGSGAVPVGAFTCPSMNRGGLPPTNTPVGNREPGQNCPSETVVDQQAPRMAYAVNEALCPRNKFIAASFGGSRSYRYVRVTEVARTADTVLATEMIDNAAALSYDDSTTGWVMSHRPIPGFVGLKGELDAFLIPTGEGYRRTARADLDGDPNTVGNGTQTRLDLVGRNHGKRAGYPDRRLSNFLYCDGHAETKSVYDTVLPWQWGDRFYSLVPNDDLVGQPQ